MPSTLHSLSEQIRRSARLSVTGTLPAAIAFAALLAAPRRPEFALLAGLLGASQLFGARAAWLSTGALRIVDPTAVTTGIWLLTLWNVTVGVALVGLAVWRVFA